MGSHPTPYDSRFMMRSLLIAAVLLPASSFACELTNHFKVIGFDAKETLVAMREESEGTIAVHLYELPSGKRKSSWDIINYDETTSEPANGDMSKLGKLRAARWKEAEAALVREGIKINAKYPISETATIGKAKFITRSGETSEYVVSAVEVVRIEGKESTVIDRQSSPTANDAVAYDGFSVAPSKKTLIILPSGCGAAPVFIEI